MGDIITNEFEKKIVLCGDIGGTNSNFCIASIDFERPKILYRSCEPTGSVKEFSNLVNKFMDEAKKYNEGYQPDLACFAVAGPVMKNESTGGQKVIMTNIDRIIDTDEIIKNTQLSDVLLINDFEAISYAINVLNNDEFIVLNKGKPINKATKAVIGAGTGLGKNILFFNETKGTYTPIPSEGGRSDLPVQDEEELKLLQFIKSKRGINTQVSYEDVLSGQGLEIVYSYLSQTKYKDVQKELTAIEISKSKNENPCSRETFNWFMSIYARAARNFALDSLARGGLYIAGGIAVKNTDSFSGFVTEFIRNEMYEELLRGIPVYLIINYEISLIGSAFALKSKDLRN